MAEASIRVVQQDGFATVTLDRPEARNALDVPMLDRLPILLEELASDEKVGCVVLTGAGDKAFSAGGDVRGVGGAAAAEGGGSGRADMADRIERWAQATVLLHEMPKPTLGVINGVAAGAGMGLALACDLRIGCERSRFITSFARIGMSGDFGGSHLLTRLVGPARARELYWLSDPVTAEAASALGLLNWLVPAGELHDRARQLALRLVALPPGTRAAIKDNLNASLSESLSAVVHREAVSMARTAASPEAAAATAAFFRKSAGRA